MDREQIKNILKVHLPDEAVSDVVDLIAQHQVYLRITKSRSSKYGDFRVPGPGHQPKLSINDNLNQYAFLVTLLHEVAHLLVWRNHQLFYRRIKPHGIEWKNEFKSLLKPFLKKEIFPEPLLTLLKRHMLNPKASSSSDVKLMAELKKFDDSKETSLTLTDFQIGDFFNYRNTTYRIIRKNRTRYLCENVNNKKRYLVHSLAEVEMIK